MQSFNRYLIDAESVLRAEGSADIAAATNTDHAVKPLTQTGAYWQAGQRNVKDEAFDIVIDVNKVGTGNATLGFEIVSCSDAAKTNPRTFASFPASVGQLVISVDPEAIKAQDADASHWFLRAVTVIGTGTVAANWSAFAAPRARR